MGRPRKPYSALPEDQKVKVRARSYANTYQRRGRLARETCARCGAHAEKHHPDYSRPLHVEWLCKDHHRQMHEAREAASHAEFSAHVRATLRGANG